MRNFGLISISVNVNVYKELVNSIFNIYFKKVGVYFFNK